MSDTDSSASSSFDGASVSSDSVSWTVLTESDDEDLNSSLNSMDSRFKWNDLITRYRCHESGSDLHAAERKG